MWGLNTLLSDGLEALQPITKKKLEKIENLKHKSDYELVDYVYSVVKGLPIFNEVPSTALYHKKSNEKADESRRIGNELFIRNFDFVNAVEYYTQAVANAELGSESLSLAYSNRSHVLLDQRYYKECLQDIDRALKCNYTENLKQKLLLRQERAEELKRYQKNDSYHDPLPEIKNKNKFIESSSNSIAIRLDENRGPLIVATKDIRIGEVLAVEAPYVSQTDIINKYLHCHECLELCFNMIACDNCTEALYCSENCKEQAYKSYHKYECILIQYGLNKKTIFLRLSLKSVLEYDRLIEDLSRNDDIVYQSNRYKEIYQMETYKNSKDPKELYQNALEPVVFYHYLTTYTDILKELNVEHKERVLKELLLKNYFIVGYNNICIEKLKQSYICTSEFEVVGSGVYSLYTKFQHSCFSNTFLLFYGNKIVVKALTKIRKGEHVTTSFGITFANSKKSDRQTRLQKFYNYTCHCEPCLNDWPMSGFLEKGAPIPKKFMKKVTNLFASNRLDRSRVKKLLVEAYALYENLKITEIPTENYILLRCVICELFLCFANKIID
ncbi:SET and MYND domain-containing protein DDB_G0273589-like [Anoplophora glabripennis]|uniref:SET and MYND domain-containing protein DDB_G0273589-like n=1 Tax=Anoplophora glabripennis TaxID=217634 RepID=UPI000874E45C|nr:SET and MYND domain-containing protein DDB_G0273589-like [Anoplophora glabripennis]